MRIAVPGETRPGERRVAIVPESAKRLVKAGHAVAIEAGAGGSAFHPDEEYRQAGATVVTDPAALIGAAELVLKVNAPATPAASREAASGAGPASEEMAAAPRDEIGWMQPGSILLGSLMPLRNLEAVAALRARGVTAFSTDAIPRTTRAQFMDTLSSMNNIAGYKGVLLAAAELGRYFPMLTTAAGVVFPAKVFVVGAAVAGLQAIATARRLGASVTATDVRPEVKEQVESVGAKYVGITPSLSASAEGGYAKDLSEEDRARQGELLAEQCAAADVVVTTALIGGVFAPRLITADMVRRMRPGSVVVDLAADGGGNCELSRPGERVEVNGVIVLAPLNLAATVPVHASLLFSRNLVAFIEAFTKNGAFVLDREDEIQRAGLVTYQGEIVNPRVREAFEKIESTLTPGGR